MKNIVAVVAIIIVVGLALFYIIKSKKAGKKCIGCPDGCCLDCKNCQSSPGNG